MQVAVNKLAKSGEALAAGDLPAVAATVGYVPAPQSELLSFQTTQNVKLLDALLHSLPILSLCPHSTTEPRDVIESGRVCRSDAWVGEFQRASTGLSTNEEAKRSANAIFQV